MTAHHCLRRLALGGGLALVLSTLPGTATAAASEDPGVPCLSLAPSTPDCSPLVRIKRYDHPHTEQADPTEVERADRAETERAGHTEAERADRAEAEQDGRAKAGRDGRARVGRGDRAKGALAAAAALRQLGIPFSWGGGSSSGPTRGIGRGALTIGFDCSGLTMYAWSRAGVRLGHYTGTQFRQGRRITLSSLRTGDLLFFGGGGGDPTHVGLYLQSGLMIHAPKTGDVVRTTRFLTSPYFRAVFRGAVRPG